MEKEKEVQDALTLKMKKRERLINILPVLGFVLITVIMIIAT